MTEEMNENDTKIEQYVEDIRKPSNSNKDNLEQGSIKETASERGLLNSTSFNTDFSDDSNDKDDQEIALLRQLLQAEASADACELLAAQDKFLESTIDDSKDTEHKEIFEANEKAKEVRQNMLNSKTTFQTSTAAGLFGEETFTREIKGNVTMTEVAKKKQDHDFSKINFPVIDLDKKTAEVLEVDLNDKDELAPSSIPIEIDPNKGLDQNLIHIFFGTFEEAEAINSFVKSLDKTQFQVIFDNDPLFEESFSRWCGHLLRNRRYIYVKTVSLLKKYAYYRLHSPLVLSRIKRFEHSSPLSGAVHTTRDNADPVVASDVDEPSSNSVHTDDDELESVELTKLRTQLQSGIISFIEEARCEEKRGVITLRLFLHDPDNYDDEDLVSALHYVLLSAQTILPKLQFVGFTFIFDLSSGFGERYSMKTIELLLANLNFCLPVYVGKIIFYDPPLLFTAKYKLWNLFGAYTEKGKMKRVFPKRSKSPEYLNLYEFVSPENLPVCYAGKLQINHYAFAKDVIYNTVNI